MSDPTGLRVAFVPREQPLTPAAAVAVFASARALGERLLRESDSRLSQLQALAGPEILLVLGSAEALPWVDGIAYLGHDPDAPRLLLPTALRPDVPASLFERALLRRVPGATGPLAVLASPRRIVKAGLARRLERPLLERWLTECA